MQADETFKPRVEWSEMFRIYIEGNQGGLARCCLGPKYRTARYCLGLKYRKDRCCLGLKYRTARCCLGLKYRKAR